MKQSNIPMIIVSVIAFLLLIAVVGASVFLVAYRIKYKDRTPEPTVTETPASGTTDPPRTTETPIETPSETPTPDKSETPAQTSPEEPPVQGSFVLSKTPDAGQGYIDSLTFLGDSTTYHLLKNAVLTDGTDTTQVWFGKNGFLSLPYVTTNTLYDSARSEKDNNGKLLSDMAKEKKPQTLVITLGVGVSNLLDEDDFKLAYNTVLDTVLTSSPDTKIICQSIYPVTRQNESTSALAGGINNDDIRKCNLWIADCVKAMNDSGQNVFYLDAFSALVASDGYLPEHYSNGDGLHLSNAAYEVVLENLRTHKIPD